MNALLHAWRLPLPLLGATVAALILYALLFRPRQILRIVWFTGGLALFFLTVCSPLVPLARQYLLSVEVIVHVTTGLAAPLLLVLGIPRKNEPNAADPAAPGLLPYVGWLAGSASIAVWFLPSLLNAALQSAWVWDLMQVTLMAGGVLFWWPLIGPRESRRIKMLPAGIWYLFGAMIWCSFTGMVLAFTNPEYYQPYVRTRDPFGILDFIHTGLELTRSGDQETAGLLFWIGTMAIFLTMVMAFFYLWYKSPEVRNEFELRELATAKKAREDQA